MAKFKKDKGRSPRVSVSLTAEEVDQIKSIADHEKRSESYMAAEAIRFWLRHQAGRYPGIVGQTTLDLTTGR